MKTVKVTLEGTDDNALLIALDEVRKAIENGYKAGMDSCDDESYHFDTHDE